MFNNLKKRLQKLRREQAGFTLMEMMVVVAIIAILAAIAIPKFNSSLAVANTAKVKADLQTINTAASLYYNQKGDYPASLNDLDTYLEVGKLSKPTGKIMIKGTVTDINKDAAYQYDADKGATFMEKTADEFNSKENK